ncbi:MAG TPA: family 10 glycosylhydrolase [Phnomibacter sp.]|nr:family 10 glycosylhydrolase [Phnomibacter sp.]
MKNSGRYLLHAGVIFLSLALYTSTCLLAQQPLSQTPAALREFRAAWVATVANINWPSKPGLSTEVQQKEAIALLDFLQQNNFNAVIFQVRPQCDALYQSDLEPWSYYLTGTQGKAPAPFYDPLAFWVKAAHDRGIELHVWLNPYRAHHKDGGPVSDKSIVKTKPQLAKYLKEGYWWLDPAAQGTQDHSYAVAMDIVKRYDIDGLHFDDYFYPYPSYNLGEDFPDQDSWNTYIKGGGTMSRGDWRRNAVNVFIERLYKGIKAEKPHVKFGLSPFGIWRPGYPPLVEGFDQYEQLYADAKLWLNKGWIDYFAPQLYWPINRPNQSYPILLGWWAGENTLDRHLWPGISIGGDTSRMAAREVTNQIMISRGMLPGSMGIIHWSIGQLVRNPGLMNTLKEGPYRQQALIPASPWMGAQVPAAPKANVSKSSTDAKVQWSHANPAEVWQWVVYARYGNRWQYSIHTAGTTGTTLPLQQTVGKDIVKLEEIKVSAVSRTGMESAGVAAEW